MDSQFHRHPENFKVALSILLNIKKNDGKLDSDFDLNRGMLQLWIFMLAGMDYIKKGVQGYVVTEKGKEELRWHALHSEKVLISA